MNSRFPAESTPKSCSRLLSALSLTLALAGTLAVPARALEVGAVSGDQLMFFYDGRSGRVPFLSLSNPSPTAAVELELVFYPESLEERLGATRIRLAPLGHRIIDPNEVAGGVALGNAGLAIATPVDPEGRAIVPDQPLVGSLTLANVPLQSSFGDNPIARLAVNPAGDRATPGAQVNGRSVVYQRLTPATLAVPTFFNPQLLGPVENDGNRVILASFDDVYAGRFDVAPRSRTLSTSLFGPRGESLGESETLVDGVRLTNVQDLAAPVQLDSSGKVIFEIDESAGNIFGLFAQSLGAYGEGQRMPSAFSTGSTSSTRSDPAVSGDQLLFYFDGRNGQVPFFTLSNPSPESAVSVELVFYPEDLSERLGSEVLEIAALGNVVIDPNQVAGGVAIGNAGLAIATPIETGSGGRPVVPPAALLGGFTLANVPLDSAFGENPIGRFAVDPDGARAAAGDIIDGQATRYQRLTPPMLMVPVFFNPNDLGGGEDPGNRIILVSFTDQYGDRFGVAPLRDPMQASIFGADGARLAGRRVTVSGVHATSVQEVAAPTELSSSGKIFFEVDTAEGNVFGLFSQSLGTFGAGQRMPAVDVDPADLEPTPATPTPATPSPEPSPTPTPIGPGPATPTPIPTPGATATPSPEPTATPSPTPAQPGPSPSPPQTTPSPTPAPPTPSPTPPPGPTPSPSPGPTPSPSPSPEPTASKLSYAKDVEPILTTACATCHLGGGSSGGFNFDNGLSALLGTYVVPGDPGASLLWQRVNGGGMPPQGPLPGPDLTTIRTWIVEGAEP